MRCIPLVCAHPHPPVLQWAFKLKRDEHSDFCFCFQSQEQAHRWFDALSQVRHHPHASYWHAGNVCTMHHSAAHISKSLRKGYVPW